MNSVIFQQAPQSICVLRLSAIGDCCHAIAMVQAIQRQWPTTQITWVCGKVEAQLLCLLPNIEVIVFDKKAGWKGYISLWKRLKHRRFDALLHMQAALRASIASLGIKAKYRLGFDFSRAKDGQWLFTQIKVPAQGRHVLDGFMGFAKQLGVQDLTPHWHFPITEQSATWANHYRHQAPVLLVCPAASKAYKNWTAEGYAKLIEHAKNKGFEVILIGSPAPIEIELANKIQQLTSKVDHNLVGQTNLEQLMALIAMADIVVAPDTGPTHMATVLGTPVLGLYAHHNPLRTGPYHCLDYVVSMYEPLLLKQTGKTPDQLPWRTRIKDPHAMEQITAEQVIAQFDRLCSDKSILTQLN